MNQPSLLRLKRLLGATAASLAISLSGGCAQSGMARPAAAAVELPPPGTVAGPALWKLADQDTTIYLFGTVHALPKDKPWLDARIQRAFGSADELVTEIDISTVGGSAQVLRRAGMLPEGSNLRELMNAADRQQYEAALVTLGVPVGSFDRMKPWMAAMTLTLLPLVRAGYDQASGVETTLTASTSGPQRRAALESVDQQVALFDSMPLPAQLKFLDGTVEDMDKVSATLDAMVAEWLEGDAEGLAALLNADFDDPVLYERLLTNRNATWAEWIDRRLDTPGTVFMAVGAGHLAGTGSVQDQLARRGLKVERVWQ